MAEEYDHEQEATVSAPIGAQLKLGFGTFGVSTGVIKMASAWVRYSGRQLGGQGKEESG